MKAIGLLTLIVVCSYFLITALEPKDTAVTLTKENLDAMARHSTVQRVLWILLIVFQALLLYRLYTQIPKANGYLKYGLMLYFGVILTTLIVSTIILFIAFRSLWL